MERLLIEKFLYWTHPNQKHDRIEIPSIREMKTIFSSLEFEFTFFSKGVQSRLALFSAMITRLLSGTLMTS